MVSQEQQVSCMFMVHVGSSSDLKYQHAYTPYPTHAAYRALFHQLTVFSHARWWSLNAGGRARAFNPDGKVLELLQHTVLEEVALTGVMPDENRRP